MAKNCIRRFCYRCEQTRKKLIGISSISNDRLWAEWKCGNCSSISLEEAVALRSDRKYSPLEVFTAAALPTMAKSKRLRKRAIDVCDECSSSIIGGYPKATHNGYITRSACQQCGKIFVVEYKSYYSSEIRRDVIQVEVWTHKTRVIK